MSIILNVLIGQTKLSFRFFTDSWQVLRLLFR